MPKEYIQAPTFDLVPPPNGPLKLGHILDDPTEPRYPLNEDDLKPPDESAVHTHSARGISATRSQLKEAKFSFWAKLTDLVPASLQASEGRQNDSTDTFTIESIETIYFLPSKKYLEAALQSTDVRRFLEASRWGATAYIITGLKVARGASITTHKLREKTNAGEASLSLHTASAPVGIGSSAEHSVKVEDTTEIDQLDDFVLGYQLRKIPYKKGKPVRHEAYNVGATFDSEPVKSVNDDVELTVDEWDEDESDSDMTKDDGWQLVESLGVNESSAEEVWVRVFL